MLAISEKTVKQNAFSQSRKEKNLHRERITSMVVVGLVVDDACEMQDMGSNVPRHWLDINNSIS